MPDAKRNKFRAEAEAIVAAQIYLLGGESAQIGPAVDASQSRSFPQSNRRGRPTSFPQKPRPRLARFEALAPLL
jgi:hypothetical protein